MKILCCVISCGLCLAGLISYILILTLVSVLWYQPYENNFASYICNMTNCDIIPNDPNTYIVNVDLQYQNFTITYYSDAITDPSYCKKNQTACNCDIRNCQETLSPDYDGHKSTYTIIMALVGAIGGLLVILTFFTIIIQKVE